MKMNKVRAKKRVLYCFTWGKKMSTEKKSLRKYGEAIWNYLGKITGKILRFLGLEVKVKPRFFRTFAMFILLIAFSTISIHFVEERSWFDSLYFTVSTISTVGFGDITPQSTVGKIIVILLIIFGIAIFFLIIESFSFKNSAFLDSIAILDSRALLYASNFSSCLFNLDLYSGCWLQGSLILIK